MSKESPYRSPGRTRKSERVLTFFHARFIVLVVVALVISGAGIGAIDVPHDFELRCVPSTEPRIDCVSTRHRPLRRAETTRVSITPSEIEARPILLFEEPDQPSIAEIDTQPSWRGVGDALCWYVVVRWSAAEQRVHEDCSSSHGTEPSLTPFREALNRGETATLSYRSGWGGFGVALPLVLVTLCLLWLGSGRTRVTFDADSGSIVVQSRPFWRMKAEQQRFSRSEIAEVFLLGSTEDNGAKLFRPAFRDTAGQVHPLGTMGLAPERAQHFVKLLTRMLAEDPDLDRG